MLKKQVKTKKKLWEKKEITEGAIEEEVTEEEVKDQTEDPGKIEILTRMPMDLKLFKMIKTKTPEVEVEEEVEVEDITATKELKTAIINQEEIEAIEATEVKEETKVGEQDQLLQEKEKNSVRENK